ncbi:hypothetical protein [Glaciimonas sp. PCH181]|uniref:hypothetical protein n=1 Tax=Glaciimonas sp. PCH181 TaxID=2133943 RepID=UPI000D338A4F|nr:hypothetical protein [Glaciimonas sp. PCH181]PUA16634.1 hypothetical protein C7W93_21770 [Glaciimonas sp. PCH181]
MQITRHVSGYVPPNRSEGADFIRKEILESKTYILAFLKLARNENTLTRKSTQAAKKIEIDIKKLEENLTQKSGLKATLKSVTNLNNLLKHTKAFSSLNSGSFGQSVRHFQSEVRGLTHKVLPLLYQETMKGR